MKRLFLFVLCLAVTMSAVSFAEENLFEKLSGLEWMFCSGAGGWSTDMRIMADGSFTGEFHDSEMGDSADEYPDGTVYFCSFSGRLSAAEQADVGAWKIRVEKLQKDPAAESIDDGIRYVPADVCGLTEGDVMVLYAPGTPVSILSEEMQLWAHVADQETPPSELEDWFLMSESNNSGFVGYSAVSIANPWEEMTAEQLAAASGLAFGVPDGAENPVFRYLRSENLAEMQFTFEGDEFCARTQPLVPAEGGLEDISGMYYDWVSVEPVTVGGCRGTLGQAQDGGEGWAELCLWYDAEQGLMYSLSVLSADPDGLDLTALAEQVYNR